MDSSRRVNLVIHTRTRSRILSRVDNSIHFRYWKRKGEERSEGKERGRKCYAFSRWSSSSSSPTRSNVLTSSGDLLVFAQTDASVATLVTEGNQYYTARRHRLFLQGFKGLIIVSRGMLSGRRIGNFSLHHHLSSRRGRSLEEREKKSERSLCVLIRRTHIFPPFLILKWFNKEIHTKNLKNWG